MDALNQLIGDSSTSASTPWTIMASIFYYSTRPIVFSCAAVTKTLLVLFSPIIHLVAYFSHALLLPLSLFRTLEVCN